jgi:hypothetical protein
LPRHVCSLHHLIVTPQLSSAQLCLPGSTPTPRTGVLQVHASDCVPANDNRPVDTYQRPKREPLVSIKSVTSVATITPTSVLFPFSMITRTCQVDKATRLLDPAYLYIPRLSTWNTRFFVQQRSTASTFCYSLNDLVRAIGTCKAYTHFRSVRAVPELIALAPTLAWQMLNSRTHFFGRTATNARFHGSAIRIR